MKICVSSMRAGCLVVAAAAFASLSATAVWAEETGPTAADCDTADATPSSNNCFRCYQYQASQCPVNPPDVRASCLRAAEDGHKACRARIGNHTGGGGGNAPLMGGGSGQEGEADVIDLPKELLLGDTASVTWNTSAMHADRLVVRVMWREGDALVEKKVGEADYDSWNGRGEVALDLSVPSLLDHEGAFVVATLEDGHGTVLDARIDYASVQLAVEGDYNLDGEVSVDDVVVALDRFGAGKGDGGDVERALEALTVQ